MRINQYVHTYKCVYKFNNSKGITVNEIHEVSCKKNRKKDVGDELGGQISKLNFLRSFVNKDLLKV